MRISIANDFSPFPIGRKRGDGPYSGEAFMEDQLIPALEKATAAEPVEINLDDAIGLTSSFLEEAFGGLIRRKKYTLSELKKILTFSTKRPDFDSYIELTWDYIEDAEKAIK